MYLEKINKLKNIQDTLHSDNDDYWISAKDISQYSKLPLSAIYRATQKGLQKANKATGKNIYKKAWVDSFIGGENGTSI